jgi:hypothetical protein
MILSNYLFGLDANDWDTPGIFGIQDARRSGNWRILCSYTDGKYHKQTLFAKLAPAGQQESAKTWQLHHVVERQHYADIDFAGQLLDFYYNKLPCVLLSQEEHRAYNGLLHCRETTDLFRDESLPIEVIKRAEKTTFEAKDPSQHNRLLRRAEQIQLLYENAYDGDCVLATVARNVINFAVGALK